MKNKKNILLFTLCRYSHVIPLKELICELVRNYNVYMLSSVAYKHIIEEYKATFIEYPFDTEKMIHKREYAYYDEQKKKLYAEGKYEEAIKAYFKSDALIMMNIIPDNVQKIENILDEYQIDIIFRDAAEVYGWYISNHKKIKTIGYITNNLYSENYFKPDLVGRYTLFYKCIGFEKIIGDNFYINIVNYLKKVYKEVALETKSIYVKPFLQFDPNENLNIIFSPKFLQPEESYFSDKKYLLLLNNSYPIEPIISEDLKSFIYNNENIIYISTGSYFEQDIKYYEILINYLISFNYRCIISGKKNTESIRNLLKRKGIEKLVYVSDFLPQKYILSEENVRIFITSGGFNSILEAIHFKKPMLVLPITSEQRLNGKIIDDLEIGTSTYLIKNKNKRFIDILNDLNFNPIYKENLLRYSSQLKRHKNQYASLKEYIDD